jgi:transcriptional regulator with XRE-family HTH domain
VTNILGIRIPGYIARSRTVKTGSRGDRGTTAIDFGAIGERLRRAREVLGLSFRQVADRAGVSHTTVERLEKAQGQRVSVEHLARVAGAVMLTLPEVMATEGYEDEHGYEDLAFGEFAREYRRLPEDFRGMALDVLRAINLHAELAISSVGARAEGVRVLGGGEVASGEADAPGSNAVGRSA